MERVAQEADKEPVVVEFPNCSTLIFPSMPEEAGTFSIPRLSKTMARAVTPERSFKSDFLPSAPPNVLALFWLSSLDTTQMLPIL